MDLTLYVCCFTQKNNYDVLVTFKSILRIVFFRGFILRFIKNGQGKFSTKIMLVLAKCPICNTYTPPNGWFSQI